MDVELTVDIAMPAVNVAAHVAALAVAKATGENSKILWPSSITFGSGAQDLDVHAHASYRDGICLSYKILPVSDEGKAVLDQKSEEIAQEVLAVVSAWAAALNKTLAVAAPLSPVFESYFDVLMWANDKVDILYPNGNLCGRATLSGLDVFGQAIVIDASGKELSLNPLNHRLTGAIS